MLILLYFLPPPPTPAQTPSGKSSKVSKFASGVDLFKASKILSLHNPVTSFPALDLEVGIHNWEGRIKVQVTNAYIPATSEDRKEVDT